MIIFNINTNIDVRRRRRIDNIGDEPKMAEIKKNVIKLTDQYPVYNL